MKIEYLIQKIEELVNASSTNFEFKVYDSLKMDNQKMDINKINGIARVTAGGFEPIASLGQGSVTISVEFIYPYERLEAVNETLQSVAQNSAGLVVKNSSFSPDLIGTTGIAITYPIQGNYYNGTMGETAKSRLICYFDINEKAVLANDVKIEICGSYKPDDISFMTTGTYYKKVNNSFYPVHLPNDYNVNDLPYYQINSYDKAFDTDGGIFIKYNDNYMSIQWPQDYVPGETYYWYDEGYFRKIEPGEYYERSDFLIDGEYKYTKVQIPNQMQEFKTYYVVGDYSEVDVTILEGVWYVASDNGYKAVKIPQDYVVGTTYYTEIWEEVPYYKQVITRHRLSTTNKYENNSEMQTINDGQSIDISLAVPSIKGSVINDIKRDMIKGTHVNNVYQFRITDEDYQPYYLYNMIASGDFSYEVVPGDTVIFKILFVYKR